MTKEGAQSPGNVLVDERIAEILAADFRIPLTDVRDALMGQPEARAIGVCGWAAGQGKAPIKRGEALTAWAKKNRAGIYAVRGGRRGGETKVARPSGRVRFTPEQILANLERMGG